jgi:hypothetical protein
MMPKSTRDLIAALQDLLGDQPDIQQGQCIRCGRDYSSEPALEGQCCPSDDCPAYGAREALARGRSHQRQLAWLPRDLKADIVYVLKEALIALNTAPNFRCRGVTTSYDVASQIERVLHRLRAPASYDERRKGGVP